MINLGGNVLTLGDKPDGSNYNIGIQKPFSDDGTAADAGCGMKFVIVGDKNGFRVIQGFYQLHATL